MAADEMSNKEIAQALFVTVKTVEQHLGRVYRKLDIGSAGARQLAAQWTSGTECRQELTRDRPASVARARGGAGCAGSDAPCGVRW
jgi:DNA-binding NarL/FixJ family response regulator